MFRRIVGYVLLVVGILGVVLSIAGIVFGSRAIDGLGLTVKEALSLTSDSLVATKDTLVQSKTSVQQVTTTLANVETAMVNASETVNQADGLSAQVFQIISQDVPDSIDAVHATIPATAQTAKTLLGDVETAMVNAGTTVNEAGPLFNQMLKVTSRDVPDTIDQFHATIPATVQVTKSFLGNVETTMVDASQTVGQTDVALKQVIDITSQDVPDAIDEVHATIPPMANATKNFLGNVEVAMVDASESVQQADAALSQAIEITSQDVPDTIDAVHATIPPAADAAHMLLGNVETTMVDASKTVEQTDAALNQMIEIASQDFPNAIDEIHATIPATADVTKSLLDNVETTMVDTSRTVDQADQALDRVLVIASEDLPDTIDQVNATVGPVAESTQDFLANVETTLGDARSTVKQTDQALQEVSGIVSEDVPDTIDEVNSTMSVVFDTTEGNVNTTLALLKELDFVDQNYRVRMDQPSSTLSNRMDRLSTQLRGMDEVFNTNLLIVDQGISQMSRDVAVINRRLDQLLVTVASLDDVSQQFRDLESVSDNNLGEVSDDIRALSREVGGINDQIDELVAAAAQLEKVSDQLRELESISDNNLDEVSQGFLVLAEDVGTIDEQIDAFVRAAGQLDNVSGRLRGLESVADNNLDTVSQDILVLSKDIGVINGQVDQVVKVSDQLGILSGQLRQLESVSDNNLGSISQDILALSGNVAAINQQIDQVAASADSLQALSSQLRTLEPYSDLDITLVGQDILTLSNDVAAVSQQIDQIVAVSDNLAMLSDQLRSLEDFSQTNLGAISQNILTLSQDVTSINQQVDEFVTLMDRYIGLVDTVNTNIAQTQAGLDGQLALFKTVFVIAMLWILLGQLAPLYLGWELAIGQRNGPKSGAVVEPPPSPEPEPAA